jgi:hypothetical protein
MPKLAATEWSLSSPAHRRFPFSGNILFNTGVGPITLDDVYTLHTQRPMWPGSSWTLIQAVLLVAAVAWVPCLFEFPRAMRSSKRSAQELMAFGVVFLALNFGFFCQAFKLGAYDRYFLPCFLGAMLAIAPLVSFVPLPSRRPRVLGAIALGLPLAWLSVAGVHDMFRWQSARWALVARALESGSSPLTLAAGYEVGGWLNYDATLANRRPSPSQCRGGVCGCRYPGELCMDDSYRVGMSVLPGFSIASLIQPSYWLAEGPPVILSVRDGPGQ